MKVLSNKNNNFDDDNEILIEKGGESNQKLTPCEKRSLSLGDDIDIVKKNRL